MFSDEDLLPISALQHFFYCSRQAALIHLERAWRDNPLTVEGTHLHRTADSGERQSRVSVKLLRAVALVSYRLGLIGRADVVEFQRVRDDAASGVVIDGDRWLPRPVEYKRGRPKKHHADEVQLCAQALCLEETLGVRIAEGDLFYGATRRRKAVPFDARLRDLTVLTSQRLHELFASRRTPAAEPGPKCKNCSLSDLCQPWAAERSASRYLQCLFRSTGDPA